MSLPQIMELDKELLLLINGSDSVWLDNLMMVSTQTFVWIPLMLGLLYLMLKSNSFLKALFIISLIGLVVLCADQFASGFCKPYFARLRPTHDPALTDLVDVVNNYRGGMYGFMSSHAANTLSVVLFLSLIFKSVKMSLALFSWAFLACYTRMYLGVHYPGDILCGGISGLIIGACFYYVYYRICNKYFQTNHHISTQYTSSGYCLADINLSVLLLLLNYLGVIIYSFVL